VPIWHEYDHTDLGEVTKEKTRSRLKKKGVVQKRVGRGLGGGPVSGETTAGSNQKMQDVTYQNTLNSVWKYPKKKGGAHRPEKRRGGHEDFSWLEKSGGGRVGKKVTKLWKTTVPKREKGGGVRNTSARQRKMTDGECTNRVLKG